MASFTLVVNLPQPSSLFRLRTRNMSKFTQAKGVIRDNY